MTIDLFDVLDVVVQEHLTLVALAALYNTSHEAHSIVLRSSPINIRRYLSVPLRCISECAAKDGNLLLLQLGHAQGWFPHRPLPTPTPTCGAVVPAFTNWMCVFAARRGDIEMLDWLKRVDEWNLYDAATEAAS